MSIRLLTSGLLVGIVAIGSASGQTTPSGGDPHHTAGNDAEVAGEPTVSPPAAPADAGIGSMMTPDMMQMMMQMMALHHPTGQMAMPGMIGDMAAGASASLALGPGPEAILGLAPGAVPEMTPETVRAWMQDRLDRLGNPRLSLGTIEKAVDGSITAEVRTVDGALVQKLSFNRYPGFVRQVD